MDLGTGSGAIALGLATLLPATTPILAVDASPDAAVWAQLNIQRLHRQKQVQARQQSLHLLLAPQPSLLRDADVKQHQIGWVCSAGAARVLV